MAHLGTILPSSPLAFCEDRFSLLPETSDPLVPVWRLIEAVLSNTAVLTVEQLIGHLEVFSICLHRREATDFSQLEDFLRNEWDTVDFLTRVYPVLVPLALELPLLFPSGAFPTLTPASPSYSFSRKQIACIVVHQFLCTLFLPSWMPSDSSPDFHIWYGSGQPHAHATRAYLCALFTYFNRVASMPWITELTPSEWPISLTLRSSQSPPPTASRFTPFTIKAVSTLSTDSSLLGLPSGACVIFAHKYIGFGRTGTQEEIHVGCSPEACPVSLFTPPLRDDQVAILEGVEAVVSIDGYGRDAKLKRSFKPDYGPATYRASKWLRRTMLFMDALELDTCESGNLLADLLPGHIDRELTKAYAAFSFRNNAAYNEVVTGLWGCGAFGGNPDIKTILQWCAASIAGVPLTFICEGDKQPFLLRLEEFTKAAIQHEWRVETILALLRSLHPEDEAARHAISYIMAKQAENEVGNDH